MSATKARDLKNGEASEPSVVKCFRVTVVK